MNKNLQKAIMNRSRMLNRYRKKKKTEPTNLLIKDREFLCETIKKDHIGFCNKLDVKCITENKKKQKNPVKSSFTDKTLKDERITLVENNKVVKMKAN